MNSLLTFLLIFNSFAPKRLIIIYYIKGKKAKEGEGVLKVVITIWYEFRIFLSCLNFWDEAWWILSLRVFGLLSSSLLLFPQSFARYVLRPSSSVCRTREPTQTFELPSFIECTGVTCSDSVSHNRVKVLSIPVLLLACCQDWTWNLPDFDKHLRKAGGHIGRNVVEIIIMMTTIVRKPIMIRIFLLLDWFLYTG